MNNNQNPNLGTPNGTNPNMAAPVQGTPGINPVPTPVNPNPNMANPVNPAMNPTPAPQPAPIAQPAPTAPAPAPTPMMPNSPVPNAMQVPNQNLGQVAVAPMTQMPNANLAPAGQQPVTGAPIQGQNMGVPGVSPVMPNQNGPLPGMAPNPGMQPNTLQPGPNPNPNVVNNIPPAPATNPQDPNNGGGKKFDTKTIMLIGAAVLAVIICIIYFLFLNPNKKKPAPAENTNNTAENETNNNTTNETTNNTTNTTNTVNNNTTNTTPEEPEEPEEIDDYDMSWLGTYTSDDMTINIYYTAPKEIEIEITTSSGNSASSSSLPLEVTSLKELTYNDDYIDEELNFTLTKTDDGIEILSESSDEDSILNIDDEFIKEEEPDDEWSGFYEIDGGHIIINALQEKTGRIDLQADNSKYASSSLTYEIKNNTITIKGKSSLKGDTTIKRSGDDLVVTSNEYLAGTYTKLK